MTRAGGSGSHNLLDKRWGVRSSAGSIARSASISAVFPAAEALWISTASGSSSLRDTAAR